MPECDGCDYIMTGQAKNHSLLQWILFMITSVATNVTHLKAGLHSRDLML